MENKEVEETIKTINSIQFIIKAHIMKVGFHMNGHLSGKELFIRFTASAFCKLLSIYVFSCFPFGFEGRMWDLIVSVPDHCLSFYFSHKISNLKEKVLNELHTCNIDGKKWFLVFGDGLSLNAG